MQKRQTFEEVMNATLLVRGTGEIGEDIDEILFGEVDKKLTKDKVKKVRIREPIHSIPYPLIANTVGLPPQSNDHFQQWLYRQKQKDQIIARFKFIERENARLEAERAEEKRGWAKDAFKLWKYRKDIETYNTKIQQEGIEKLVKSLKNKPNKTETLPGYISTWSCDTKLARKMHKVCPRTTTSSEDK